MYKLGKHVKPLLIILLIICSGIVVYTLTDIFSKNFLLEKYGVKTIATVESSWRSRCGSGYGNFVYYSFKIQDVIYKDTSDCNAPFNIKPYDQFSLLFMEGDPSINRILFDEPVKK